jgi:hypothetical protein
MFAVQPFNFREAFDECGMELIDDRPIVSTLEGNFYKVEE